MKTKSRQKTQQTLTRIFGAIGAVGLALIAYGTIDDAKKVIGAGCITIVVAMIGLLST